MALALATAGPVTGLVDALSHRASVPSVPACLALLLSPERIDRVAEVFDGYADNTPTFWSTLEQQAVAHYAKQSDVGLGLGIWLWRWDKPFAVVEQWISETGDLNVPLQLALTLPCPALRARMWQAVGHFLSRIRWRNPEQLDAWATETVCATLTSILADPSARGRNPRAWIAHPADFEAVSHVAAKTLVMFHRAGIALDAYRDAVEQRLGDLPTATLSALVGWLDVEGIPAAPTTSAAPTFRPPTGVEQMQAPHLLVDLLWQDDPHWAELASLRLLELGPTGEVALVHGLAHPLCRDRQIVSQAVALISTQPGRNALTSAARDRSLQSAARFYLALAAAEAEVLADGAELATASLAEANEPARWLNAVGFERFLGLFGPEDEPDLALRLWTSAQYAAYRWSVRALMARTDGQEIDALRGFLRLGSERPPAIRVEVASALWARKDPFGLPILAARRIEHCLPGATTPRTPVPIPGPGIVEMARAGMLAGEAQVPSEELLNAFVEARSGGETLQRAALVLLRDCAQESTQWLALKRLPRTAAEDRTLDRLAHAVLWGREQARELLKHDMGVHFIAGDALGWTRLDERSVRVNPLPLLRGERHGFAIVQGLIIHELGHHLYNADEQGVAVWKQAREQHLSRLHNLVCDEHLERNLRARHPTYNTVLKQLAAWAFLHAQTEFDALALVRRCGHRATALIPIAMEVARAPGAVRVRGGALFRQLEHERSSFSRFVRALRMGLGNRWGDPKVGQALALFDRNFRTLDNEGLFDITRRLRDIFGHEAGIMDLLDVHDMASGDQSEGLSAGNGMVDAEVQARADEIERLQEAPSPGQSTGHPRDAINVADTLDFPTIDQVQHLVHDATAHAKLVPRVARPARRLREALLHLGLARVPVRPRIQGYRLDRARLQGALLRRDPRLLVSRRPVRTTDLFVGVCVDCSGSMARRIERAREFATLLATACRGLSSVDLRLFGFNGQMLFDAGTAERCAAHALVADGGNNDAAALWHMSKLARRSRRSAKLLVMISDGLPTQCSADALRNLVHRLERGGLACAQIAVARLVEPCFDHYLEVLDTDTDTAARQFGQIVQRLVANTLRGSGSRENA